jgi:hypothetical protein
MMDLMLFAGTQLVLSKDLLKESLLFHQALARRAVARGNQSAFALPVTT